MMKLFEKYLLACTNQRIPMPKKWQDSLGLSLDETKQEHAETGTQLTGYRFQQDETINRGFVHREVRSLELNEQAKYLISLYLNALKEHKKLDFTPYFNVGVTVYQFPYYITKVNLIRGEKYSIYGDTLRPVYGRVYSDFNHDVSFKDQSFMISCLSSSNHYTFDPAEYLNNAPQAEDEYFMLELKSFAPIAVIQGTFTPASRVRKLHKTTITPRLAVKVDKEDGTGQVVEDTMSVLLPSAGIENLEYADKLMPLLLDMTITEDSPQEEIDLVGSDYFGDTLEEKVKKNTKGLYDVDKYIGGKFLW